MPQEIHKTVFISYRRKPAAFIARAIFEHLTNNGYDVFMDVETIDAGDWKRIIENQIRARAHFLVVLTAGTIGKFDNPTDMMRYEIEYAMQHGRNIVPLLINDFKFNKTTLKSLTGKLTELPKKNGAPIRHELFDGSMSNLCDRFLNKPVDVLVVSAPDSDQNEVAQTLAEIAAAPVPTAAELNAEKYAISAFVKQATGDLDGAIIDYDAAIRLNPEYAYAYYNRASIHHANGALDKAIEDYSEAIRLDEGFIEAYNNRGGLQQLRGDLDKAISDFDEAIRLNPNLAFSYNNRGNAYTLQGNLKAAIADYDEAIRLNPQHAPAYYNRGIASQDQGDLSSAIADFDSAILYNPQYFDAFNNRGRLYAMQEDWVRAIADFDAAIRLSPNEAFLYVNRGLAHEKQGDTNRMILDFTDAIRLQPREADFYISRGEGYFTLGKYSDALIDFQKANSLRAGHNMTLADLAITQFMLNKMNDAQNLWRGRLVDERYRDADWVGKELNWRPELVEAARKLIATL